MITACCFLFMFVNVGLPSTSFSVHLPYIVGIPGVGDAGGSLVLSARSVVSTVTLLATNSIIRAIGVRWAAVLGCVLTGMGFFFYAAAFNLVMFLVGAMFAGAGYGVGGYVCMTIVLNRWCPNNVGSAIGIAAVGSSAAGVVVPFAALGVASEASPSVALAVEGAAAVFIAVFVAVFLRSKPGDVGLGVQASLNEPAGRGKAIDRRADVKASRVLHVFLVAAMAMLGAATIGGMQYMAVLVTSNGFDWLFAGTMVSIVNASLMGAKLCCGRAFDALGGFRASALFFLIFILGFIGCTLIPWGGKPFALVVGVTYGFGVALGSVGISVWSINLAASGQYFRTVREFQLGYSVGGILFSLVPGILMDTLGTYNTPYALMLVCTVICACIVLYAYAHLNEDS